MTYNLPYLVLTIAIIISSPVYGQISAQTTNEYKKQFSTIDSLNNLEYYEEGRTIARKTLTNISPSDWKNIALCNYLIGVSFTYIGKYDSAISYYKTAYNYGKKTNDSNIVIKAGAALLLVYNRTLYSTPFREKLMQELKLLFKNNITIKQKAILLDAFADYYYVDGEKDKYIVTLIEAVELRQQKIQIQNKNTATDSINLGVSFLNIGEAYIEINQRKKATEYLKLARLWIYNYKEGLCNYYKNMINIYLHSNQERIAEKYADSILKLHQQSGENLSEIIITSNLVFSDYYLENNKLVQAWHFFQQAKTYANEETSKITLGTLNWMAASILMKENKFKDALTYLIPLEQEAKDWQMDQYAKYIKVIADCYFNTGEHLKANQFYRQFIMLQESLIHKIYERNTLEAEAKFQNETKQLKILQQQKIISIAQKKNLLLIIAFCAVLFLSMLLFFFYKKKKRLSDLLQENKGQLLILNSQLDDSNKTKSKLFGIISHELRSPISQVYQLLKLQHSSGKYAISKEEKHQLEEETQNATENLLDNMEDLLIWSKTQMTSFEVKYTLVDLNTIYKKCKDLLRLQIQNKKLQIIEWIAPGSVVVSDTNFLLTILRNVMHNAIKSSPDGGEITISFEHPEVSNHICCIRIINQGMAFTQEEYLKSIGNIQSSQLLNGGLGLQIIDELSRKIGLTVAFESLEEIGTCCILTFPKQENTS